MLLWSNDLIYKYLAYYAISKIITVHVPMYVTRTSFIEYVIDSYAMS